MDMCKIPSEPDTPVARHISLWGTMCTKLNVLTVWRVTLNQQASLTSRYKSSLSASQVSTFTPQLMSSLTAFHASSPLLLDTFLNHYAFLYFVNSMSDR